MITVVLRRAYVGVYGEIYVLLGQKRVSSGNIFGPINRLGLKRGLDLATPAQEAAIAPGWLRSPQYDVGLIGGVLLLALISGLVVVANPALFKVVLLIDIWFLGYHHVVATFTRLSFDAESLRQHRFLVFGLPPIVFAATFALAFGVGVWVIASVYLYWQWFHYTRQSWGINQVYRRKSDGLVEDGIWFSKLSFYLLPAWGILYRSWQDPGVFLGLELRVIPVPELLVDAIGFAALASVLAWVYVRVKAWQAGNLAVAHTLYMVSHYIVFFVGYWVIEDITYGWLVINVWHNAQYILFVWLFNTNRYKGGIDPKAKFLSGISQPNKFAQYFLICFGISTAVYFSFLFVSTSFALIGVPLLIIIYQAINFHHYIVDGLIWKIRKKPLQKTLGLKAP